ncbi:MAG: hypothetical protein ACHQFW_01155 [Chitinophagales bacterium]
MRTGVWLLLLLICTLFSCNNDPRHISRSFYFWKHELRFNEADQKLIDSLNIQRLYIKFFDVKWERNANQPIPVADITFTDAVPDHLEIIPVVFITNETFIKINNEEIKTLALKISKRIEDILNENKLKTPGEIQLDCDWSESTKEKYFLLIDEMKKYPVWKDVKWSATIRLHQVKYFEQTGVPPVDRGMLMFYNMGNIEESTSNNSIYDEEIALNYVKSISAYPLVLDAAIACFSWGLLFDGNELLKIFYPLYEYELPDSLFSREGNEIFIAKKNFYFEGQFMVEGNRIRLETMSPELSEQSAKLLAANLNNDDRSVILYHFDPIILNRFHYEGFENIFTAFE